MPDSLLGTDITVNMPSELNVISTKINEPIEVIINEEEDLALKVAFQLYTYADFEKITNRVYFALKCFERANDFVKAYNVFKHKNKQLELLKQKNKEILEEDNENISTSKPGVEPDEPTEPPTSEPTEPPTSEPTEPPTSEPTEPPTSEPTEPPTSEPTEPPTSEPTEPLIE